MRFNTKVDFLTDTEYRDYDPVTSTYIEKEPVVETRYCDVNDLSTETQTQVFNRVGVSAYMVRHLGKQIDTDKVKLNGKIYYIIDRRQLRNKATYLVSEELFNGEK